MKNYNHFIAIIVHVSESPHFNSSVFTQFWLFKLVVQISKLCRMTQDNFKTYTSSFQLVSSSSPPFSLPNSETMTTWAKHPTLTSNSAKSLHNFTILAILNELPDLRRKKGAQFKESVGSKLQTSHALTVAASRRELESFHRRIHPEIQARSKNWRIKLVALFLCQAPIADPTSLQSLPRPLAWTSGRKNYVECIFCTQIGFSRLEFF